VREIDDLVEGDARLRRVHDALVAAGPPAELPPELATPPGRREKPAVRLMPRRRLGAALVLAAALALAGFGGGYLLGAGGDDQAFPTDFVLVMHGTDRAPNAIASLAVGELDEAGNWPMAMTLQGLPELPRGERYELLLTKSGEVSVSCGTFIVSGKTRVYLNAPYRLRDYDGWVVTREDSPEILLRTDEI
jgi:hypothetical protein